jgi:hypothetical protein
VHLLVAFFNRGRSWWLACCLTSRTYRSCSFCFYIVRSLWATEKMRFRRFCVFHVSCPTVVAVHVRESNGIFATWQSSEASTFCGKLLLENICTCWAMSQVCLKKHILEVVQGEIKNSDFRRCSSAPERQTTAPKTSLMYQCPGANCLLSASLRPSHSQRSVVPSRPHGISMNSRFAGHN